MAQNISVRSIFNPFSCWKFGSICDLAFFCTRFSLFSSLGRTHVKITSSYIIKYLLYVLFLIDMVPWDRMEFKE